MTVHTIGNFGTKSTNPGALCVWFVDGEEKTSVFPPATLQLQKAADVDTQD
jgi:hypothetical protein